jgi:hypothetical protein
MREESAPNSQPSPPRESVPAQAARSIVNTNSVVVSNGVERAGASAKATTSCCGTLAAVSETLMVTGIVVVLSSGSVIETTRLPV